METTPEVAYGVPIISVVGDGYCVPYPVELTIRKKFTGLVSSRYEVLDANGNLLFQVEGSCKNLQKKLIMRDPVEFPILTMREKALTIRHRWTVHGGESSERSDLLFSMQRTNPSQLKSKHDVFLASNIDEDISNFQIVGCFSSHSCKVCSGDYMIAEANHSFKWGNFFKGKESLRVKVNPEVDYALIVALIVIHSENDEV